ncbi:hypothetical protein SNR37_001408 [Agarivorans aestuarii]|uniref:Uncharacterized protein n=1 Tax=Agarivorans aestuarii TaxID=1563703 RepID=A0ABU7G9N5_9ALTE|nr:hypothetical protein [Agarivorans aestuarii]MEE1676081.1 hypothetical protein [Agarivorans aestuarii]
MRDHIDFYCYQPLLIHDEHWINFLSKINRVARKNQGASTLRSSNWSSMSEHLTQQGISNSDHWLSSYTKETQGQFLDLLVCNLSQQQHINLLQKDLVTYHQDQSEVFQYYNLDPDHSSMKLMLVNRSVFMLVFHIRLQRKADKTPPVDLLKSVPFALRAMVEDQRSGSWSQHARETAIRNTQMAVAKLTGQSSKLASVSIKPHTGHVLVDFGSEVNEGEKAVVKQIHEQEEINFNIASEIDLINDHPGSFAHFGWSYSTVYGLPKEKSTMCLPFMLYLQACWFLAGFFKEYLLDSMIKLSDDLSSNELKKQSRQFDSLVMAHEISLIKHSQYKGALKPWQFDAFEWVERYWQLGETFEQLKSSMATNKEFVERKISYNIQNIEQRQSFILFVITLIQMLTIVSFFKDYFDLLDSTNLPNKFSFVENETFDVFNLYLPLFLVGINLCFITYIYRRLLAEKWREVREALQPKRLIAWFKTKGNKTRQQQEASRFNQLENDA